MSVDQKCGNCARFTRDLTFEGRKHPGGNGRCDFVFHDFVVPEWVFLYHSPTPSLWSSDLRRILGGTMVSKRTHMGDGKDCPAFCASEEAKEAATRARKRMEKVGMLDRGGEEKLRQLKIEFISG